MATKHRQVRRSSGIVDVVGQKQVSWKGSFSERAQAAVRRTSRP